ncbi:MAG: hypothetical protein DIU52_008665 [bacterium]
MRIGDAGERRARWMEIFFDPVFSVAVSEVAERSSGGMAAAGVARFPLLFGPVW